MRLQIASQRGHFNWADPSEESIVCHIRALDDDGASLGCATITTDEDYSTDDFDPEDIVEDAARLIENYYKRVWFATARQKDMAFAGWLRDHKRELTRGCVAHRITQLERRRDELERLRVKREWELERYREWLKMMDEDAASEPA